MQIISFPFPASRGRKSPVSPVAESTPALPKPAANASGSPAPRRGFTLVELLVVIAIIGLLAALLAGVAANAGNTGRVARSKAMISRLHTLVMEQYDSYRSRRANVNPNLVSTINATTTLSAPQKGRQLAEARLYALRELMVAEMPDRWSDVWFKAISASNVASLRSTPISPAFLDAAGGSTNGGFTPLNEAYRRQCVRVVDGLYAKFASDSDKDTKVLAALTNNQGAECLYMFVMFACGDGEARGLFPENQIGDTDGDGAPEFIDGWGEPVEWLRWAPGYISSLHNDYYTLAAKEVAWNNDSRPVSAKGPNPRLAAYGSDHDPFDMYRVDDNAVRLVPLIFSGGTDKLYGIYTARNTLIWNPIGIDPYIIRDASPDDTNTKSFLGTPVLSTATGNPLLVDTTESTDNITNHLIQAE